MKKYEIKINNKIMIIVQNKELAETTVKWYIENFKDITIEITER